MVTILYPIKCLHIEAQLNIIQDMLLLSVLLIAFVTYFIWKPLLAIAPANQATTQETFEQIKQQFQQHHRPYHRPKNGYQGGEYIDFEEL